MLAACINFIIAIFIECMKTRLTNLNLPKKNKKIHILHHRSITTAMMDLNLAAPIITYYKHGVSLQS